MVSTDSLTDVFRGGHRFRSIEKSPFSLASSHRSADHLVPRQSRFGCSGRCYAGAGEYPRLRQALQSSNPARSFARRSLAVSSALVAVAVDDAAVGPVVALACVCSSPDHWILLIVRVFVRVGVHGRCTVATSLGWRIGLGAVASLPSLGWWLFRHGY